VAAVESIPQGIARRLQLAMFRGSEAPGALLELRYQRPAGTVRRLGFYDAQDLEHVSVEIERVAAFANVWVGAAPRAREDGTADGVLRVHCVWVDVDGRAALERLAAFDPLPALVIRSGSPDHAHAYWPLRAAIAPSWAKRANRRLAQAVGGDMGSTDATRILRPAGSLNHKTDPPRPVRCTRLELEAFTLDEVVGRLPDAPGDAPRRPAARRFAKAPGDSLGRLVRTVREAAVGERNALLFWAACRAQEEGHEAREELHQAALAAGLAEHEIESTLSSAERRAAA
jgi:RepB DNA-primase from phage plasmid